MEPTHEELWKAHYVEGISFNALGKRHGISHQGIQCKVAIWNNIKHKLKALRKSQGMHQPLYIYDQPHAPRVKESSNHSS